MNTPTKSESQENSPPSTPYFSPQSQSSVSYLPIPTNSTNSQTEMTENEIKTTNDLRDEYNEIEASMNKLKLNYIADKKEIEAVESNISEVIEDLEVLIQDIHAKAQTHSEYQDQSVQYQPSWLAAARLKKENESTDLASFYATFQDLQLQTLKSIGDTKAAVLSQPSTLVILSPDSYKHVFSRNWYSKSYKASVVERPERLLATSIGIGTAFAQHPTQFTLHKTNKRVDLRTATSVKKVHGLNWANQLYELCKASESKLAQKEVEVPENWHSGDIYLAPGTINAVEGTVGAIEDAVDALYNESSHETGGFENVFVAVRPPGHHSRTCQPSGFCLINNVHIAIQYAAENYAITHAVVLDFDLHHGDGTQDICWKLSNLHNEDNGQDEKETDSTNANFTSSNDEKATQPALTNIGYFSLHDINSFPTEEGYASASNIKDASVCVMAHGMCVWNVHLEKFTTEEEFMELYDTKYSALFVKAHEYLQQCHSAHVSKQKAANISTAKNKSTSRNVKSKSTNITVESPTSNNSSNEENDEKSSTFVPFNPLIILSAGFDASEYENINMRRHGVQVPNSFYYRFTRDAKMLARVHSDGAKVLSLLEGGYSDGALSAGVYSHLAGFASASEPDILVDSNSDIASKTRIFSSGRNNPVVTKLMEQGCKRQWDPARTVSAYKRRPSSSGIRLTEVDCQWLAQGIGLGRLLWPLEFLQPAAVSTSTSKTQPKKLAKEVGSLIKDFEKLGVVEDGRSPSATDVSDSDVRTAGKRVLRNRSHLHQTKDF